MNNLIDLVDDEIQSGELESVYDVVRYLFKNKNPIINYAVSPRMLCLILNIPTTRNIEDVERKHKVIPRIMDKVIEWNGSTHFAYTKSLTIQQFKTLFRIDSLNTAKENYDPNSVLVNEFWEYYLRSD